MSSIVEREILEDASFSSKELESNSDESIPSVERTAETNCIPPKKTVR